MTNQYKQLFLQILKRYRLGKASADELVFLEKYYNVFEANEDIVLSDEEYLQINKNIKARVDRDIELFSKSNSAKMPAIKLRPSWASYVSIAAMLMLLVTSVLIFRYYHVNRTEDFVAENDIEPGGQHAFLTLANGKTILLDTAATGQIANESGIKVSKTEKGQLIYFVTDGGDTDQASANNTITTPKGGNYQVILPDGTAVMLNAASSLTFPTSFKGLARVVSLEGEAYFEVKKNTEMPFIVKSREQVIEVLGTHFDVNAYADEPAIKTTLLEGAVKVTYQKASVSIKPGQQAVIDKDDQKNIKVRNADLEREMAWKNGVFSFENDDLKSIMRQVARWYDVEVIYEGKFPDDKFFGGIPRNSKLSAVAKILELNNIQLIISGKTIRVSYQNPAL
jgi:transmembrane sensor